MPLKIIVIGAGFAGLAAALGLARKGHEVHVFERRLIGAKEEGRAGLIFSPNVSKVLREWDMLDALPNYAHDHMDTVLSDENGELATISWRHRGHSWWGRREELWKLFHERAVKAGAKVVQKAAVVSVDVTKPAVVLEDGTVVKGDLLVGADGVNSRVRTAMYPDYRPTDQQMATFQIVIPWEKVKDDALVATILKNRGRAINVIVAPGRSCFVAATKHQQSWSLELQVTDHEYGYTNDPNPSKRTERLYDLTWLKQRFASFGPGVRRAFDLAESAFKWRHVEVMDLPRWSTPSGKVVIIGDAAHAQTPFAGQGGPMGVESGAYLAELLADKSSGDDLTRELAIFEKVRRPRCEATQRWSFAAGLMWALSDAEAIEKRNAIWRSISRGVIEQSYAAASPESNAHFATPAFMKWMDTWDLFQSARDELNAPRL